MPNRAQRACVHNVKQDGMRLAIRPIRSELYKLYKLYTLSKGLHHVERYGFETNTILALIP